ncbi:serine/threonine protein kinase [Corallococcus praedator]|uniref:Serine/threonine protein kinase n=1 Tax=Corallococcus praedator TaxID=2316724 RepID=A0ABX9QAW1_9BACT|nr:MULTISPECIES: serine/threonine-protein kinase [Corallococcus]RKH32052.1 serine/threonine protein kinase [Corallococcus sp. CA031C]RKH99055.1 serine/threonine protein kinase [Corallococcus praedator]
MIESDAPRKGAPADVTDPLLGRVLNERFRILETLGAGGMGRVYKAMQAPLDRLVALKVLNPQYSGEGKDPGFQKRFFLEASVTAKLRHPNTVTVIDYGKTEDGIYYIAMEYLEGLTLSQLLTQEGPLPWDRALSIAQQVARSLREAHKVGLIHRDLKPANVMVLNQETDHDVVKVLDFGLVKSFLGDANMKEDTTLTQAGVILGSPQYMAPEQARNIADPRSDVYSLGVVLYQILMGRPPFQAAQSIDVIVKHINDPPPSFHTIWPDHGVPPEVETLVMKCLAKRPVDRYASMDAVLQGMRAAASASGVSGVFSSPRTGLNTVGSGPHSGPHTGPHALVGSGPNTVALDISVDEQSAPQKKSGKGLGIALFGGCVLLGIAAAAVFVLRSTQAPPPVVQTSPRPVPVARAPVDEIPLEREPSTAPATPPPAAPKPVRFQVVSDPPGAEVTVNGTVRGTTPMEFEQPPDGSGLASVVVSLALDGYQPVSKNYADNAGKTVAVSMKLTRIKKQGPKPKAPGSAYKDDPYQ